MTDKALSQAFMRNNRVQVNKVVIEGIKTPIPVRVIPQRM